MVETGSLVEKDRGGLVGSKWELVSEDQENCRSIDLFCKVLKVLKKRN